MRIARAAAHNLKGFADFDQNFGDVVVISGRNGEGKSTVLDLVYSAFVTDSNRDLLRTGEQEGWILVVLEDEGETIEIRRTLEPGKVSEPKIKRSGGGSTGAYGRFIKELLDTVAMDPLRKVMTASPERQVQILLETIPMDLDQKALIEVVAPLDTHIVPGDLLVKVRKMAALDAIKTVSDAIYSRRTDLNREAKAKRTHAKQLTESIGQDAGQDWKAVAAGLEETLSGLAGSEAAERRQAEADFNEFKRQTALNAMQDRESLNREINLKIAALEEERNSRRAWIDKAERDAVSRLFVAHQENLADIDSKFRPERSRLTVERDSAQQNAINQARIEQTRKIAAEALEVAGEFEADAGLITKALGALDQMRTKLLEKLPIRGLRIEGGKATLDGVPIEELNTASRALFWIRVAVMRAMTKSLGVVLLDDCEHLDDTNWPKLLEACKASGVQFLITRVAPHPLKIESV